MPESTHGTGTATQFTSGEARYILELGDVVHYFNPSDTPVLTISLRASKRITPVPVFEWMEDEYFIQRSQTFTMASSANLKDASSGVNDTGSIIVCDRQSQVELFEKGGIYTASVTGGAGLESMVAYMCIAIGDEVALGSGSTTDKMVQLVGFDAQSTDTFTYDEHASGTDILTSGGSGTLTLVYYGTAGEGSVSGLSGAQAGQTTLTNNETFEARALTGHAEGAAIHRQSTKKVRRPKNCTMIFREPYNVTGTAEASIMYGPMELTRKQERSLKKVKTDLEWALLTRGTIDLDADVENPKRLFQGFGVSEITGVVQSNNADIDSALQLTEASFTMSNVDDVLARMFKDVNEGSTEKDLFVSADFMKAFTARVRAESNTELNVVMGADIRAGLRVVEYHAPIGHVNLIRHPLFEGTLAKYALAVDWSNFDIRPLRTRDLMLRMDVVKDGSDGRWDEWLWEVGPEIRQEQTHSILKLV